MGAVVFTVCNGLSIISCHFNKLAGPFILSAWQNFKDSSVNWWLTKLINTLMNYDHVFRVVFGLALVW